MPSERWQPPESLSLPSYVGSWNNDPRCFFAESWKEQQHNILSELNLHTIGGPLTSDEGHNQATVSIP